MCKIILCLKILLLLNSFLPSQNINFKGQFNTIILTSNDVPNNWHTHESVFGYLPTLSLKKETSTNKLFDFEWAYNFKRYYVDDSLYNKNENNHRLWVRYSVDKIEARFGLQKIVFGPTQILRPLSWFDTFDLKDPTGQTKGVEALRLRWFPSNNVGLSSWIINNKLDTLTFGGRCEVTTSLGDFGFTYHKDPSKSRQLIGQVGLPIIDPHQRIAFDYRFDGFIGFWNESAAIKSDKSNINLFSIGADYTLPFFNGILIMIESMYIQNRLKNLKSDQSFSAFMASIPIGMIHQVMYISQIDWEEDKAYQYLRWSSTYDSYSLNIIISINPKRKQYDIPLELLPKSLSNFGTGIQFMFIYNH